MCVCVRGGGGGGAVVEEGRGDSWIRDLWRETKRLWLGSEGFVKDTMHIEIEKNG